MTKHRILKSVLVVSASLIALTSAAAAQGSNSNIETVVVTGSRIITNGNAMPTPVTVVSTDQLAEITPSNVPEGLDKLPVFAQSSGQQTVSGATSNGAGNFLNLRGFGTNRTLILLDGNRVPATAQTGTVNIDTLPQMLMQRVDVVTGGASAVYGSDAITGVVNFVLNKTLDGIKVEAQSGVSSRGDDMSWKAGIAAGWNALGDRGHFEVFFEHYNSDGIDNMALRPLGSKVYTEAGLGTTASPYYLAVNSRYVQETPGGYISNGPLQGNYFPTTGVIAPYSFGTPLNGNAGASSGGDGGYSGEAPADCWDCNQSLIATLHTNQAFGRFDYQLSDDVHSYLQFSGAQTYNYNSFFSQWFNQSVPASNIYLPASASATLAANKITSFTMERQFEDYPQWSSRAYTQNIDFTVGFNGTLFSDFTWNAHYTYGLSSLHDANPFNTNNQKLTAALDSALTPAGGATGNTAVCAVTLTANASLYPGCVPLNPFGPNAPTAAAVQYIDDNTDFHQYNSISDAAGDIGGTVFQGWAGPIKADLAGEYRFFTLETKSNFNATNKVNCTGLNPANCNPNQALYGQSVVSPLPGVGENVWETAVEVDAPILANVPLVQMFSINAAARYAHYSISGPASTWKLGAVWTPFNDLTIRATNSRDFRAPTLFDLYAPASSNNTGFQDLLTGVTANTRTVSQGNPNLKPEVSLTTTAGFVYTPSWLDGFSLAVDMFQIGIKNAVTSINGTSTSVQQLCNSSAGASPYCALYVRPISPTSTASGNYPLQVLSESLNVARTSTHGFDGEANYHFDLADIDSNDLEGILNTRFLLTYQPSLITNTGIPGAVVTNQAGAVPQAALRWALDLGWTDGPLAIHAEERWHSKERQSTNPTQVFLTPPVNAIAYTDMSLTYDFTLRGRDTTQAFLTVNNLFDQQPHIWIPTGFTSAPGFAYPAPKDEDVVGRYFTLGFKYRL